MHSQYTSAYSEFLNKLKEVDELKKLAVEISKRSSSPSSAGRSVNVLCRAGVVLLSSHIEGYIKDLGGIILQRIVERKLPRDNLPARFKYYFSRTIIDEIKDTTDHEGISNKIKLIFDRDTDIWSGGKYFSDPLDEGRFLDHFSVPSYENINKFFSRFGYENYRNDLATRNGSDYDVLINMVSQVVAQRNQIAHGDFTVAGAPSDLNEMILGIKKFCKETDKVVGDWFKSIRCPIR